MKAVAFFCLMVALIVGGVNSAFAWDFNLRTEYELRYRYIARTGPNDLFGNVADAQRRNWAGEGLTWPVVTSIGLSGAINRYVQIEGLSSKGSDAAYAQHRLWLYPHWNVNNAISLYAIVAFSGNLNARYNPYSPPETSHPSFITEARFINVYVPPSENWGTNPHYSGWINLDSRDHVRGVGMAAVIAHALWGKVQFPFGTVVFGRRPAGFGLGWVAHQDDNYATSLSVIVPYGPLTFVVSQYLHDNGEDSDPNTFANRYADFRIDIPSFGTFPHTFASTVDQNQVIDWNQAYAVVYRTAALDMGAMARIVRWSNIHTSSRVTLDPVTGAWQPDGTLRDDALYMPFGTQLFAGGVTDWSFLFPFFGANGTFGPTGDVFFLLGSTYLKYMNGPFAFNGEYDFQLIETRPRGARPVSGFPQAWAAELSYMTGPLKLSLAHFYRSGHDRRGFLLAPGFPPIGPLNTAHDRWNLFLTRWGGGQAPIRPYNFLLGLYGTGNNSYNSAGECTYKDFLAWAARIDYSLAANLNVFASFIHAQRASNTGTPISSFDGWRWTDRGAGEVPVRRFDFGTVPDMDLGYELDVGLDWKLLENLRFKFLFGYWQPGNWYKWAYADRSRAISLDRRFDNPGRTIDPLIGIESSLLIEF